MSEHKKTIEELEAEFPTLADAAFAAAHRQALAAGLSVLQSENGVIYEIFPDGTRVERKRIEPPTFIPAGTIFTMR